MGKFKSSLFKAVDQLTIGSAVSRKKLILSVVSLILAFTVLVSSTFCWFALKNSNGQFNSMGLLTDVGLRSNDVGERFNYLTDHAFLLPASSVDGRNMYFPSDGTDFSSDTTNITYRTANTGDKNDGYLQYDFDLMAEANYTSVYIDLSHTKVEIKIDDNNDSPEVVAKKIELTKAIRTAVFYDGMPNNKPIIFNSQNKTTENYAVDQVDRTDGSLLSTSRQRAAPFRDYTYGKTPIAVLDQGEKRRFSIIVWIEGTDENCIDDLGGQQIDFQIGFTTSWDHKAKIVFEDQQDTIKNMMNTNTYSLYLNYNDPEHNITDSKFPMYYDSEESTSSGHDCWYCYIPDNAEHEISFQILNSSNNLVTVSGVQQKWEQNVNGDYTLNRLDATKYINDGIVSTTVRGHWYDGDIEDKGNGSDNGGIIDFDEDW